MTALTLTVLTASLLGSLHCGAMCGPFVAFAAADSARGRTPSALPPQIAYSLGRLLSYVALGALAGSMGGALDVAGSLLGIQRVAAILTGIVVLVWGLAALLTAIGVRLRRAVTPRRLTDLLARGVRSVAPWPPTVRAFTIGLLTACLPCGWLWAFVLTAAGAGSALSGSVVMLAFWSGTVPVMISLGLGLHGLLGPVRRHLPAACAVVMIALGLFALSGRVRSIAEIPSVPSSLLQAARPHADPGHSLGHDAHH